LKFKKISVLPFVQSYLWLVSQVGVSDVTRPFFAAAAAENYCFIAEPSWGEN
jgi:hypothetical protein